MSLPVIPDVEVLAGAWLREHPDIQAFDARVAGRTPSPAAQRKPWIRLTQFDANDDEVASIEHLIDYLLQLDCYAGEDAMKAHTGQAEASALARAARAVLKAQQGRARDGVVISKVTFQGMPRIPDADFEPARERVILTATIRLHALPA